jgi:hypothetical protein
MSDQQPEYTEKDALKHIVRVSDDAQVKSALLGIVDLLTSDNYHDLNSIDVKTVLRDHLMTSGSGVQS